MAELDKYPAPREPGPVNPYAVGPGAGGPGDGEPLGRPWWETAILVLAGLCLAPFFLPDTTVAPGIKLTIGLSATALLIVVFVRRIRAIRGKFLTAQDEVRLGGPKPYHLPPSKPGSKR